MESESQRAFAAVRAGDLQTLRNLIQTNSELAGAHDDQGLSLLLQAAYFRRVDMVPFLLAAAPPISIFEAAALPSMIDCAESLLRQDPSLACTWSADGFTALHLAAYFGQTDVAKLLLEHGSDPEAISRNPMALRPLHSAAASQSHEIMRLLIDSNVCVDAQQQGGWTALHAAASHEDLRAIELLLVKGANARLANDEGKTPLDMAIEKGHSNAVERLRSGR
jgi:ankyrin repeat protein